MVLRLGVEKWVHVGGHFETGAVIGRYEFVIGTSRKRWGFKTKSERK